MLSKVEKARRKPMKRTRPALKKGEMLVPDKKKILKAVKRLTKIVKDEGAVAKKGAHLSATEKIDILEMHAKDMPVKVIAASIGRGEDTIRSFVNKYRSTCTMARLHFESGADKLARRVVNNANVSESLEVLDRLNVLPKRNNVPTGNTFNVIVGMPSTDPADRAKNVTPPIPTQAQIKEATDA